MCATVLDKCPLNRAQTGNEHTCQEWLAVSTVGLPHRVVTGRVELAQLLARYTPPCFDWLDRWDTLDKVANGHANVSSP